MPTPINITLFLPKGDATSLRIAGIKNWSGLGIAAPRKELPDLLTREELERAGVYILLGIDPEDGEPLAYIGEAEVLRDRLRNHHTEKDFWNQVMVFTSNDENLTKAHIRYLENLLITEALDIARSKLENKTTTNAKLPEADRYDMAEFLYRIKQLLPVLGADLLTPISEKIVKQNESNILYLKNKAHVSRGNRTNNGFVVYKGSEAVVEMRPAGKKLRWLLSNREKFLKNGILTLQNNKFVFTKDVEFSSPSTAATIICGGAANGLKVWKNKDGRILKELEA